MRVSVAESKRLSAQRYPNFTDNLLLLLYILWILISKRFRSLRTGIWSSRCRLQLNACFPAFPVLFLYLLSIHSQPFFNQQLLKELYIWLQDESLKWSKCRGTVVKYVITPFFTRIAGNSTEVKKVRRLRVLMHWDVHSVIQNEVYPHLYKRGEQNIKNTSQYYTVQFYSTTD